jgi:lysophospholipase L1-like esterase
MTAGGRDVRLCFFGDSFVLGVGDPDGLGWVGRVAGRSGGVVALTAYNLGVRSDTSADVVKRWKSEAAVRLPKGAEGRVVFSFGVNDAELEGPTGTAVRVPASASFRNLASVLRAVSGRAPALVVGPPAVSDDDQNERIGRLSAGYGAVCAEHGVPYVEVFDRLRRSTRWMSEVRTGDDPHPGRHGYEQLAELVWGSGWRAWIGV